jgi:CRISPR-associated protein Cmr4
VETGGLWYQESLPAETVLISLLRTETRRGSGVDPEAMLQPILQEQILQIGGKATTGQGLVRLIPAGGAQ